MLQSKEKNFVSCVIYLHDEGERIREFLGLVCGVMRENFEKYEIVCVDDLTLKHISEPTIPL